MTKHTPGPWHAANHFLTVKDQTGEIICHVRSGGNLSADASLIAAAPDLLAALRETVTVLDSWNDDKINEELLPQLRAAIAKAEAS